MAGLLEYLGSGKEVVPRNMKQVAPAMKEIFGERLPNAALGGPEASAASRAGGGLLRMLRMIGGPVALGVQAAVTPGELGNSDLYTDAEAATNWANDNPEAAVSAAQYGKDLSERIVRPAINAVKEAAPPKPPEVAPEEKEVIASKIESQRQTIQLGALEGLKTGAVSRPQIAQAVVEADAQRAGKELKPEENKAAVQQELVAMKTMDNNDLSKYASYALVAGGVLASFLDKSGRAGEMFGNSFNKQLDRNLTERKITAEQQAAAAKLALEGRKVGINEKDVDSKIENRSVTADQNDRKIGGLLGKWENDAQVDQAQLGQGAAKIGLMGQRLSLDLQNANIKNAQMYRKLDQNDELLKIRAKTADAAAKGKAPTGVPLSFKDNSTVIDAYFKASGQKVDKSVSTAAATRLGTIQKLYPDLSLDQQAKIAMDELSGVTQQKSTWWGLGDDKTSFIDEDE